ncbi:response regulator transcription factor [Emticicia sp. BO119]|uniref:response regulator transcription factor n=1 Tax=Emticicia sp. BO119 TaxID=2757768 RepID=UPI0015F0CEEB|nr:response regulator transcription factor [Emticicia sp. BO119]MBA4853235.1 response regulator transcription factor [Emticicia sp. BO119]
MTYKIKLFLADSYSLFLEGLSIILNSSDKFEITGFALNQQELLAGLKNNSPDVLLLDFNMLFQVNTAFAQDLKKEYANKILILYDSISLSLLKKLQIDAEGFLSKTSSSHELYDCIQEIYRGKKNGFSVKNKYVYSITPFQQELVSRFSLTDREVEVIKLIALEFSSMEIANKLCVSEFTVDTYRKNISRKLNARNVASIVNFAHRWELI